MSHVLWEIGNWPNGIVVGNLMASVIWASVFEWRLRIHRREIHRHLAVIHKSVKRSTAHDA